MRRDVAILRNARYIARVGCPSIRQSHGWTLDNLTFGGSRIDKVLPIAEPTGGSASSILNSHEGNIQLCFIPSIFHRSNIITVFFSAASNAPITG